MKIVIGISGASGSSYAVALLKRLRGNEIHLIITEAAKLVIKQETSYTIGEIEDLADYVYHQDGIGAPIASGSFRFDAMVIIPCSIKTLSAIASSYSDNLLIRAADVALKEKRRLILCTREMPLHEGHLNMMMIAARLGSVICPLSPAFYNNPMTINDILEQVSSKIIDLLGIEDISVRRWAGLKEHGFSSA